MLFFYIFYVSKKPEKIILSCFLPLLYFFIWKSKETPTCFKISSFVFSRGKKLIQVWNNLRIFSKFSFLGEQFFNFSFYFCLFLRFFETDLTVLILEILETQWCTCTNVLLPHFITYKKINTNIKSICFLQTPPDSCSASLLVPLRWFSCFLYLFKYFKYVIQRGNK